MIKIPTWYWVAYLITMFVLFIVPEAVAIKNRPRGDTLSECVWRWLKVYPGQSITQWSAQHAIFAGVFVTFIVWLTGHFLFKWWS